MNAEMKEKIIKALRNSTGQILMGAVVGWTSGYYTMKIGRPIAFGAGCGLIVYQIALHNGYIKPGFFKAPSDWQSHTNKVPQVFHTARRFAKANRPFALGFVGGLLMGLSI